MKLTKNFSKSEFECNCGCDMPKEVLYNVQKVATFDLIESLINEGELLQGGLGKYNNFTHYDIRKNKARWDYSK